MSCWIVAGQFYGFCGSRSSQFSSDNDGVWIYRVKLPYRLLFFSLILALNCLLCFCKKTYGISVHILLYWMLLMMFDLPVDFNSQSQPFGKHVLCPIHTEDCWLQFVKYRLQINIHVNKKPPATWWEVCDRVFYLNIQRLLYSAILLPFKFVLSDPGG